MEWFSNVPLADVYGKYLKAAENLLVPGVVLYEVYKILKREIGEEKAIWAASYMKNCTEIPIEENQYVEFKSEAVKAMDLVEEIVDFSNSEGGEIWLGVEDDGTLTGLLRSYEEDVMGICRTACIPAIQPQYDEFVISGHRVGRIQIPRGKDKPYYTSLWKYYIRFGSTKRIASCEDLTRLFQASGALHYDLVEIDRARVTDLDLGKIGNYFTRYHISFF